MTDAKKFLIGAHTSAAGGVHRALLEGKEIGATTIQLFTSNQRRWEGVLLTQSAIDLWKAALEETGLESIMSHASYLLNLGAPDEQNLVKSRIAFKEEIKRCLDLNISFLNFHPGAALKEDPQVCLDRIVESLLEVRSMVEKGSLKLLLETTAGQGSSVGCTFEQLAYIVQRVKDEIPIGVCIDTCHVFVAGYEVSSERAVDQLLTTFDQVVGLQYLKAFHLNDSLKPLGSRVDRHKDLGEGLIGIECFRSLMQNPKSALIPKYLETPGGPEVWRKEIDLLKKFGEDHAHKN